MHQLLQSYLRRLTNLNSSNRSLYLPRLSGQQYVDVHALDHLNNFPSFKIIEWLIAEGQHDLEGVDPGLVPLCPVQDPRHAASNAMSQQLKQLTRAETFFFEEQGVKDLYVAWPFVRGKFADGTLVRCPLLFFPVTLLEHRDPTLGAQWVLRPRAEVALALNKSFILAYAHYHQSPYDEALAERTFDDFDQDSRIFRTSLYQLFKEASVELNFNQEMFVDTLLPFESLTKAGLQEQEKAGELKLYPEAVLGIFPQAGSYLVPDYLQLINSERVPDVESFFARRSSTHATPSTDGLAEQDPDLLQLRRTQPVKEEQIFAPYRLDAYQEKALRKVKQGNSIVVQGPPGTGKSQLIVNLIADYAAQGKRVLLVCQKRAALDVVYNRLKERDAHPFVALVHDFKNDRPAVYQQISKQVDALYEYQLKNNSLDSIFMERNFLQYSRHIEQICEELDEFKEALFDQQEAGISVKELYLTSDPTVDTINVKQEYHHFRVPELPPFVRKLRKYINHAQRLDGERHPLSVRKSFATYGVRDYQSMRKLAEEIPEFKTALTERVSQLLGTDVDFVTAENIQHQSEDIAQFIELLDEADSYRYFQEGYAAVSPETDSLWLANIERIVNECYQGEQPEVSLPPDELGKFQGILSQAQEARMGQAQWAWWRYFSQDRKYVQQVFAANDLTLSKEDFARMVGRLDARLNLEHNLTKLREQPWAQEVPAWGQSGGYEQSGLATWFHHQKQALDASLLFQSFRNFNEYFAIKNSSYGVLRAKVEKLLTELAQIPARTQTWEQYFTPAQVAQLNAPEQSQQLLRVLEQDFDALVDFDTLKQALEPHEEAVIRRLLDQPVGVDEAQLVRLFDNSLRLTWIDHIETKYPVLRIVSSGKLPELEEELQQAIEDKLAISQEIMLMKLRENTYYDVEYNRLSNMVTYRDLNHQLNKKRKIWPLRKVVENFQNELFNLVPCWLTSPETASAIFPMYENPLFDLVIFDEASQCFAEKGIPAMYRGQQVVVVGDQQQLTPNDLYAARWEEPTEDAGIQEDVTAQEAVSLLDLAQHYLPSVRLEGHYRSQSLDLIDFSNQHFYEGRLKMLPDFAQANRHEPAIHYRHVEGVWENQSNAGESAVVVELVRELTQQLPDKRLGVITFNRQQQQRIQDDMEHEAQAQGWAIPDTLFVKNIENVQGDERDIIIFSVAYAPNAQGKMAMQFGSLNAAGGENRLNVAVTRAREQVYVVTSILPTQLEVSATKNEGPKLLKSYLAYAKAVSDGNYRPAVPSASDHASEWFLLNHLYQYTDQHLDDYRAVRSLPFADLTLEEKKTDPVRYVGLINTDDDLFYQSESAKEMHAYRPILYRKKDWKFKYIYSRQFWHNPEAVQEALQRFAQTRGVNA
ncbi:MAG: AAA domain-containing protein [Tunicatimonas sp.]